MKKVGSCLYVHKSNYMELSDAIRETPEHPFFAVAIAYCDKYFPNYQIIKYDTKKHTVSCIESPDWDTSYEPIVGDSRVTYLDTGKVKFINGKKKNPQIYHSKELFVADNYTGFDIDKAKERTKLWKSIQNIDNKRIGNQDYWFALLDANGIER